MNKEKISPMSEATLWRLYRRLLAEHLLRQRLPPSPSLSRSDGSGIAAALTENLIEGDSLGIAPGDLVTRHLCGMSLDQIRAAAVPRPGRRKQGGWALPGDASQGLLPCAGEEQAMLALGTALAAHLHHSGSVTVLYDGSPQAARKRQPGPPEPAGVPAWTCATRMAISLHLPLVFVASVPFAPPAGPRKPPPAMPSIPVDRYDALALYRVLYESIARARTGGGPTWIECCVWPLPGAPAASIPRRDEPHALAEPAALSNMEQALRSRKLFDRHQQRQVQNALEREFAQAAWPLYADA